MVFSTTNLFKGIACPAGETCALTNCIFSHTLRPKQTETETGSQVAVNHGEQTSTPSNDPGMEPPVKRRKVTFGSLAEKPLSRAELIQKQLAAARGGKQPQTEQSQHSQISSDQTAEAANGSTQPLTSLDRPISPPKAASTPTTSPRTPALKETLNPRMLASAPESHGKRTLYLQHIHSNMTRLNRDLKTSVKPVGGVMPEKLQHFVLDEQELIKLALDEEVAMAQEQPKVYGNVIRNRIASYKKMTADSWLDKVKSTARSTEVISAEPPKPLETGLTPAEEQLILPHLVVADQASLAPHGYIVTPPSANDAAEAKRAVELSNNYEICDRCGARFRVFPDRDPESGRLTSNGPCKYHWGKKVFPSRQKTDSYTGSNEPYYPCCGQSVGAAGCTEHDDHVFKTASPARLAAVQPFMMTPENEALRQDGHGREIKAIVFDCEMGYTSLGLELIRLTAVSWPYGEQLVDVLVRPLGAVIDLNSRFSGVWPEDFANAIPYKPSDPPKNLETQGSETHEQAARLKVVPNPAAARASLCEYLTPQTPLMGHAIDNDLNATRLCHPSIVDTVLLFPHPRGLPIRFGLKMLTKRHLQRDIQMGGDKGHDSHEDAVATGDLVRFKTAEVWKELKHKGWKVENGKLVNATGDQGEEVGWSLVSKKQQKRAVVNDPAQTAHGNGLAALLQREGIGMGGEAKLTTDFLKG